VIEQSRITDFESGPFGIADGHRADIDDDNFVEVDPLIAQLGLTSQPDDRAARIIVGRKGSGKTVYLRRFQASAGTEDSVHAVPIDPDTPTTGEIVQFAHWNRGYDLTEQWSSAWRAAILRALCSHALHSPHLSPHGGEDARRELAKTAVDLMPGVNTPRSPYNQLSELIHGHKSGHHLELTLRQPRWGDFEYWLSEFTKQAPPIFFYLDAVDEEYRKAPNYWMRCQKGLFYQVMRLLRDPVFGNRLHVVISVRDSVFSSVLRSEHATRYRTDPHIRVLAWDRPAIEYFLVQKMERLDPAFMMLTGGALLSEWLGRSTIRNEARGVEEPLGDYLVRHTRLLPRDMILMGNALCASVARAKSAGEKSVGEAEIRSIVEMVAAWFGTEQLAICGNQIVGDLLPHGAAQGDLRRYTASDEYNRDTSERIEGLLRLFGDDQFDSSRLEVLAQRGRKEFGEKIDLPTVLWQNGLLGFGDARVGPEDWIFHGVEDVDRFHVPLDRDRYAFHPSLLDALGISGGGPGTRPVHPWRRGV